MKRCSLFSGSRNRNVPDSNCAQSEPNAFADMQSKERRFLPLRFDVALWLGKGDNLKAHLVIGKRQP